MSSSPDLRTTVAGIPLTSCVYNASGPRSGTSAALQKVAASSAGAVLTKSATLVSQSGNPQPRTWHSPDGLASLNSEGLPNNGIEYYIKEETIQESMDGAVAGKPYIVSLSGKTLDDNLEMIKRIISCPASTKIASVELNLACPNIIGKPIIGYDMQQMDQILSSVAKFPKLPTLGVKLPPYLDGQHFYDVAQVLNRHKKLVRYIVTINTLGNAFSIDPYADAPVIQANGGFAGLSGPAVKYTALANVRKLREVLDPDIDIVGVGGITTGQDVYELLLAGAKACQVATTHWKEGPSCFDRIHDELKAIMVKKGYSSVSELSGKIKPWSKEGAALARQEKLKASDDKDSKPSTSSSSAAGSDVQVYQMLSLVLAVLLAVMCADKWTTVNLLPSE